MKSILMRSPNNGSYEVPTDHLLLLNESCGTRSGLDLLEFLAKGSHGNPQPGLLIKQWVVLHKLTVGHHCYRQHTSYNSLEVKFKPIWSLNPYMSLVCEGIL